jgi:hypothetical protein
MTLYDCAPEEACQVSDPDALVPEGKFGSETGAVLESVYIDTGENGLFAAAEFSAITTLGQMEFVTPEEIAADVVAEIRGGNTGKDVIAGIDATVMGPSYRAGYLRQAALDRLDQLQREHGVDSVAFEILGPPRLSKLLFEAYLFKRNCGRIPNMINHSPDELSGMLLKDLTDNAGLRQQILSIGIPILMPDGAHMMRGPVIKSGDSEHGWVDLTPANMSLWQERATALHTAIQAARGSDSSSRFDRSYRSMRTWSEDDHFDVGEIAGWLFNIEEQGRRGKD